MIHIKFSPVPVVVKGAWYTTGHAVLPKAVNAAIGKAAAFGETAITFINTSLSSGTTFQHHNKLSCQLHHYCHIRCILFSYIIFFRSISLISLTMKSAFDKS